MCRTAAGQNLNFSLLWEFLPHILGSSQEGSAVACKDWGLQALTVFFPIESPRLSLVLSSQLRAPALLHPLQLSVDFYIGEILWSALWEQFSVPFLTRATSRLTFNLCMASRPWDSQLWAFPFIPFTSLSLARHNLCVVLLFAEVCSYSGPTMSQLWPLCDMAPRRWQWWRVASAHHPTSCLLSHPGVNSTREISSTEHKAVHLSVPGSHIDKTQHPSGIPVIGSEIWNREQRGMSQPHCLKSS